MQRLRQAAHAVERRLRHLAHLAQVRAQRRPLVGVPRRALDHRADRREHLAELVVQLARDLAQRVLARGDERLRQPAPLVRQRRQPRKELPVGVNEVERRGADRGQRRGQEPVDLALHLRVDLLHLRRGLRLVLVVLHQLARHRGAERRLPRLQRHPHLGARLVVVAGAGQREHAVGGVPELRKAMSSTSRCSGVRRVTLTSSCRRSASSRSVRMRSNCADQAFSG